MNWLYIHWVNATFFCTVLGCFMFCFIHVSGSLAPTHPSEMANFPKFCAFLSISWALSQGMAGSTICTCLFCGYFMCMVGLLGLSLYVDFDIFKLSNSFCLSEAVHNGILNSLGFYSFNPANTFSLVTSVSSCILMSSLIISANMSVSFRLWINCSFNCLSISL